MMLSVPIWLLLLVPGQSAPKLEPIQIQKLRVPAAKLSEFLPKEEITLRASEAEFDRLMRDYQARRASERTRRPVTCAIDATFDPDKHVLAGKIVWEAPAGGNQEVELSPWNCVLTSLSVAGSNVLWGTTPDGRTIVRTGAANQCTIEADFEYAPRRARGGAVFDMQIPSCFRADMRLKLPAGWSPRLLGGGRIETSDATPTLQFGGLSNLRFELLPVSGWSEERGILTAKSDLTIQFGDPAVRFNALVQIESIFQKADRISLVLDEGLQVQRLASEPVSQTSTQKAPDGRSRWTLRFPRAPVGPIRLDIEGTMAAPGAVWRVPAIEVENGIWRGERVQLDVGRSWRLGKVDGGGFRPVTPTGQTRNGYQLSFESPGGASGSVVRPSIELAIAQPESHVGQISFLEVSRRQVLLATQLRWRCVTGTLSQPAFAVPPGWEFDRAVIGFSGEPISTRVGSEVDGQTVVYLDRALGQDQELEVTIYAKPTESWLADSDPGRLAPRISPVDFVPLAHTYVILADPAAVAEVQGLARQEAPPLPRGLSAEQCLTYRGEGSEPLSLTMRGSESRFRVEHSHTVAAEANSWIGHIRFTVALDQGALSSLRVRSTRPLPPSIEWTLSGAPSAVERVQPATGAEPGRPIEYDLQLQTPVRTGFQIEGRWQATGPKLETPVLSVPSAESFAGAIEVLATNNGRIELITTEGFQTLGADKNSSKGAIVWRGGYQQLSPATSLVLGQVGTEPNRPGSIPPPANEGGSQSFTDSALVAAECRTNRYGDRFVHQVRLLWQCAHESSPILRMPGDVQVWSTHVTHRPVPSWLSRDGLHLAEPIPAGSAIIEVTYSQPAGSVLGFRTAEFLPPVAGSSLTALTWIIEADEPVRVWADAKLRLRPDSLSLVTANAAGRTHRFEPESSIDAKPLRVVLFSQSGIERVAWLLAVVAAVVVLASSRAAAPDTLAKAILGTCVAWLACSTAGGLFDGLLSASLGTTTGILVLQYLLRKANLGRFPREREEGEAPVSTTIPTPHANGLAILFIGLFALPSLAADDPKLFRVLVPYGTPDQSVVVSESLWRLLQAPDHLAQSAFLVNQASYTGVVQDDPEVRWAGRLRGHASPDARFPLAVSLHFSGALVSRVSVNGDPVDFKPVGAENRLDFSIAKAGPCNVEIEFVTPILGSATAPELAFDVPRSPRTEIEVSIPEPNLRLFDEQSTPGITARTDEDQTTLSGQLGATSPVRLRWGRAGASDLPTPKLEVESVQLLDSGAVQQDLHAAFRCRWTEGASDRISFEVPDSVAIWRVRTPNQQSSWYMTPASTDAESATGTLVVVLDQPVAGVLDVQLSCFHLASETEAVSFPQITPMGAKVDRGIIGVRAPVDWQVKELAWRNAEPATVKDFLARWERFGQTPLDRVAFAKEFRQRPFQLNLAFARPAPKWSVKQEIVADYQPGSSAMQVVNDVAVSFTQGWAPLIVLTLPGSFDLESVTGADVYQWQAQGRQITVWLADPANARRSFQVKVRGSVPSARTRDQAGQEFSFAAFRWPGADQISAQWRLQLPQGWSGATQLLQNVLPVEGKPLELRTSASDYSFRAVLRQTMPEFTLRTSTFITANGQLSGRFLGSVVQGALAEVEVLVPPELRNFKCSAEKASLVERHLVNEQHWLIRPAAPYTGRFTIEWSAELPAEPAGKLSGPSVSGAKSCQHWLFVQGEDNLPGSIHVSTGQVSPASPPADEELYPATRRAAAPWTAFSINDDTWWFEPRPSSQPEAAELALRSAAAEITIAADGTIVGVSRWDVLNTHRTAASLVCDPRCRIAAVTVGGRSVNRTAQEGERRRVRLAMSQLPQEVVVWWSIADASGGAPVTVPAFVGATPVATHVQIRAPEFLRVEMNARRVHPLAVDCLRLERRLDQLELALATRSSGIERTARAIEVLAEVVRLDAETEARFASLARTEHDLELARDLVVRREQWFELRRKLDALLARHEAGSMLRQAQSDPRARPFATADQVGRIEHWLADANPVGFTFTHRPELLSGAWTHGQVVRIGTLLPAILLWVWPRPAHLLRRYYPSLLLAGGLAWFYWGDWPAAGLATVLAALASALWLISRWSKDSLLGLTSSIPRALPHPPIMGADTEVRR